MARGQAPGCRQAYQQNPHRRTAWARAGVRWHAARASAWRNGAGTRGLLRLARPAQIARSASQGFGAGEEFGRNVNIAARFVGGAGMRPSLPQATLREHFPSVRWLAVVSMVETKVRSAGRRRGV